LLFLFLSACTTKSKDSSTKLSVDKSNKIHNPAFQAILDAAQVAGSILVYDLEADKYYSNDFEWAEVGRLPASTFKIPNSIIALETGIVENDSTILKWDGKRRGMKIWEQDLVFKDAFQFSCVPCYQEIARKIGQERMTKYLDQLEFGEMNFDQNSLDNFWLIGDSKISQFEQIDFLKRIYQSDLPISSRTERLIKKILLMDENVNYSLFGKTGWAIREGENNGWFVGYLVLSDKTYFFATNIEPNEGFDMKDFPAIRKSVTFEAFRKMQIIE